MSAKNRNCAALCIFATLIECSSFHNKGFILPWQHPASSVSAWRPGRLARMAPAASEACVRQKESQRDRIQHNRLTADKVILCLFRHPYRHVLRRWNWKTACLSAGLRGALILLVNLSSGSASAAGAMAAEVCYRALTSGFYSSVVQSFRYVQPAWTATLVTMALLPAISDGMEFAMHLLRGTQRIGDTIAASAIFTILATLIELFAMRHGVLVVGRNSNSLFQDVRKLPRLANHFFQDCRRLLSAATAFLQVKERRGFEKKCASSKNLSDTAARISRTADSPVEL